MNQIEIYQTEDGLATVEVHFKSETLWLNQKQMSELFDKDTDTIGLHLKNIYLDGELQETATTEFFSVVQLEGRGSLQVNRRKSSDFTLLNCKKPCVHWRKQTNCRGMFSKISRQEQSSHYGRWYKKHQQSCTGRPNFVCCFKQTRRNEPCHKAYYQCFKQKPHFDTITLSYLNHR